jgi:hypothetical protein
MTCGDGEETSSHFDERSAASVMVVVGKKRDFGSTADWHIHVEAWKVPSAPLASHLAHTMAETSRKTSAFLDGGVASAGVGERILMIMTKETGGVGHFRTCYLGPPPIADYRHHEFDNGSAASDPNDVDSSTARDILEFSLVGSADVSG